MQQAEDRKNVRGVVLNIKHGEIHDGPGIRSTLFLKGCPLRCAWCHNPESQERTIELGFYAHKCLNCGSCAAVCPQGAHTMKDGVHFFDRSRCIACGTCTSGCPGAALTLFGRTVTAGEIVQELLEDRLFYAYSGGGVTLSGGEPLTAPDFTAAVLMLLRAEGIHTALDTSLHAAEETVQAMIPFTDLFLVDVKLADPGLHRRWTGVSNERLLRNLRLLDDCRVPYEIRIPLIPGVNEGEIDAIAALIRGLRNVDRVKLLAYHDLSRAKYGALGRDYPMGDTPVPSDEMYEAAFKRLKNAGLHVIHK
ncbi:MAG: glycyl-radical enzyme activating protein [Lachnospiraceae bacterium]|nr:glycyl-radical enzyme activating protein [Lachnospiraceae bacterium]